MLVFIKAQKPLPIGGVAGDDVHIWDADLKVLDVILQDDRFIDIISRSFKRNSLGSTRRGRCSMALNRVLRTGVLKHIKNWSFRDTFNELMRNLDARAFSQFFEEKICSVATLSRRLARVDEQALREMNELLCQIARESSMEIPMMERCSSPRSKDTSSASVDRHDWQRPTAASGRLRTRRLPTRSGSSE